MTTSFTHDDARLAAAYDRLSDSQFEGGKLLVARLELKAGERVLDVGCGTGRLSRWLGEVVGPGGTVVGIDPLADRVVIARAGASSLPQVSFAVGQAEDLGALPDHSFDAVCMSAVFHWVEDRPKALAEARRVLCPGGRLGMTTLPGELRAESSVTAVFATVLARSPFAERADLSALTLASRTHSTTEVIGMVLQSGLSLVELGIRERHRVHPDGQTAVDFLEASSFGNLLRIVPEELRPSLRASLVAEFDARARGGPEGVRVRDHGMLLVAKRA